MIMRSCRKVCPAVHRRCSTLLAGAAQRLWLRGSLPALKWDAGYHFASYTDQLDPRITVKLKLLSFRTLS